MIVPYFPYPLISGGQNRTFNLLKHLSLKHEITLISFIRDYAEEKYIPEIEKYCHKVITVKRTKKAWELSNILSAGFSLYPFVIALYLKQKARDAIEKELKEGEYDVIHAETFYVMPNIPRTDVPILLVEQTIEYPTYQDFVNNMPWYRYPLKLLFLIDIYKIIKWETYYWNKAQGLVTVSEDDKNFINSLYPNLKISVIANGVDIQRLSKIKRVKTKKPTVLFIGQFKWLPNIDGAKFLIQDIWPLIKKKIPDAHLLIVGRNPTKDLLDLAKKSNSDIVIKGDVEDIRDAYGESDILLAPIRSGHGTKYKVLEAMATKTPIVGTPLALEGLNITPGKEAVVAGGAENLANEAVKLLQNPKKAEQQASKAFEFIKNNYDWNKVYSKLDELYNACKKT